MTLRIKPAIIVSVTKKPNGRLVLNYTRPEKIANSVCQDIQQGKASRPQPLLVGQAFQPREHPE